MAAPVKKGRLTPIPAQPVETGLSTWLRGLGLGFQFGQAALFGFVQRGVRLVRRGALYPLAQGGDFPGARIGRGRILGRHGCGVPKIGVLLRCSVLRKEGISRISRRRAGLRAHILPAEQHLAYLLDRRLDFRGLGTHQGCPQLPGVSIEFLGDRKAITDLHQHP